MPATLLVMANKKTQKTAKGNEIPVPAKADVLLDLRKVAKTPKPSTHRPPKN